MIKCPLSIAANSSNGALTDKKMRKNSIIIFKLIQSYMGDRKLKSTKMTPDNVNYNFGYYLIAI